MRADVVIVGAGPAGLSAAISAASRGARVFVVDECSHIGGKLNGQLHEHPNEGWWKGGEVADRLFEQARSYGVIFLNERKVWGIFPGFCTKLDQNEEIHSPYVVLATGAAEEAIPIPGWTLPGVMSAGAAQVLTNVHRVRPGQRVLMIGVDVLSLTISRQLLMAGVDVAGIVLPPPGILSGEKANPAFQLEKLCHLAHLAPTRLLRLSGKLSRYRGLMKIGVRFYPKKGVRIWGIPLMLKTSALEMVGSDCVEGAVLADLTPQGEVVANTRRTVDVDCVCISGGLYPLVELTGSAGCELAHIPSLGGRVPLHGPSMETTCKGLFVAGNITGIEGAKVAAAQGELAGTAVAAELNLLEGREKQLLQRARQKVETVRDDAEIRFHREIREGRKKIEELWEAKTRNFA